MSRTTNQILLVATSNLDDVFVDRDDGAGISPILAGTAAALAAVESDIESQVASALPSDADGEWLRLLARGLGVNPGADESDASLRARLGRVEAYGTAYALKLAADDIIGSDVALVVEHDLAMVYCDPGATEHVTDGYCDESTLLGAWHGVTVICPESVTTAQERAICLAINDRRAAGILAWAMFDDTYLADVVFAWPWEEA